MKKRWLFGLVSIFFVVGLSIFSGIEDDVNISDRKFEKNYRILVTHKHGIGEREMAERIRKCAIKLDLDCTVLTLSRISLFRSIAKRLTHLFVDTYSPNLIISLEGGKHNFSNAKKYAAMTHGSEYYFSTHSKLPFSKLAHYDGYLVSFPDKGTLKTYFSCSDKRCNYINWYTTCYSTSFIPPKNFNLFYCGTNMAQTNYGANFKLLFTLLDQTDYFNVYGHESQWRHAPKSYKGHIKHDGTSIIKTMNKSGVCLVVHSPDHFEGRTPTAKIFEAAAAGCVIISDRHPFVTEEFGDAVLYIDKGTGAEIFKQIEDHMRWIRENPEDARKLAQRAHEIFITNFTLEEQLKSLIALHENLPENKDIKDMSL